MGYPSPNFDPDCCICAEFARQRCASHRGRVLVSRECTVWTAAGEAHAWDILGHMYGKDLYMVDTMQSVDDLSLQGYLAHKKTLTPLGPP